MQNTCPKGSQTEGRQSAWQESVLYGGLPFCFWFFFLLNSTDNFGYWWAFLEKKSPTFSDVYWWLTSWRSDKAALQVGRQSDEMRGPGSFWRECLLHLYTTRTTSPSWNHKKPDLTLFTIETQPSFFLPSNTFLYRTHLSVFGVPPSRSARPQIHGNRGQWRNSHKPHYISAWVA